MIKEILKKYNKDPIVHSFLLYDYVFLPERTKVTFIGDGYILTYYHAQFNTCSIYIYTSDIDVHIVKDHINFCKKFNCKNIYIYGNIEPVLKQSIIEGYVLDKRCFIVMFLNKKNFRKISPKIDKVDIRTLNLDDNEDYNMFKEFLEECWGLDESYIQFFRDDIIFAAIIAGRVVSIARICLILPKTCLIGGVFTVPEYRRRRLAGAVLSTLCEHALSLNVVPFLFVNHDNMPALNLYRRIGFRTHITIPYVRIVNN